MRRSDKIAALEKEVTWYRDESLGQQKKMQIMKEEVQRMRIATEDAQMQVAEMELILAKQKRKNKLLRVALIKSQNMYSQLALANPI